MHDANQYSFEDDVKKLRQRLLERMPGLCDRRRSHYREMDARAVKNDPDSMDSKDMGMATYVLVADREAIEGEFVKAMWLDDHGKILMITKMTPAEIENMATMFGEGLVLVRLLNPTASVSLAPQSERATRRAAVGVRDRKARNTN